MNRTIPTALMRTFVGLFLIVLGIKDAVTGTDAGIFSFTRSFQNIEWLFGIIEIILGILLLSGFLTSIRRNTRGWSSLTVLVFWSIRVVFIRFFQMLSIGGNAIVFHPDFSSWILILSCELIIGAAILSIYQSD